MSEQLQRDKGNHREGKKGMCMIYTYVYDIHTCTYIYIYRERERETERVLAREIQ